MVEDVSRVHRFGDEGFHGVSLNKLLHREVVGSK